MASIPTRFCLACYNGDLRVGEFLITVSGSLDSAHDRSFRLPYNAEDGSVAFLAFDG